MRKKHYLKKFNNIGEYENLKDSVMGEPHVVLLNDTLDIIYKQEEVTEVDYSNEYFIIEALEDGLTARLSVNACEYRIDDGSWNNLSLNTNTPSVNKGQKISFKITNPTISNGIGKFTINKKCNLKGNIMSLLYGDSFEGQIDLSGKNSVFYKLFYACTTIKNAENLILPATTLSEGCYTQLFGDCTSLTTTPELPATTLAQSCYANMFYSCTSLTTAPELPATTLATNCYYSMFNGCTSLTQAPELPATTLAPYCYYSMFNGCTSLTTAPELPATTLENDCYYSMFNGCKSLTNAPDLPATTLKSSCYSNMFKGCSSLVTAPALPATTLALNCYSNMFNGCSKLNNITMLATNISATSCLSNWVKGVASTGTFVKNAAMTSLSTGDSGIPNGWTVKDSVL